MKAKNAIAGTKVIIKSDNLKGVIEHVSFTYKESIFVSFDDGNGGTEYKWFTLKELKLANKEHHNE
jgi:hypothetical protein